MEKELSKLWRLGKKSAFFFQSSVNLERKPPVSFKALLRACEIHLPLQAVAVEGEFVGASAMPKKENVETYQADKYYVPHITLLHGLLERRNAGS